MEALFAKAPNGWLMPISPEAERFVASLKVGDGAHVETYSITNALLLKKMFVLLELAFDHWEPNDDMVIRGESKRKDFDQFRKDIVILAGHYNRYVSPAGEVRLEAKSLSPAKCEGIDFAELYRKVLDVVWSRVLQHVRYESPAQAERVIEELLAYESGGGHGRVF